MDSPNLSPIPVRYLPQGDPRRLTNHEISTLSSNTGNSAYLSYSDISETLTTQPRQRTNFSDRVSLHFMQYQIEDAQIEIAELHNQVAELEKRLQQTKPERQTTIAFRPFKKLDTKIYPLKYPWLKTTHQVKAWNGDLEILMYKLVRIGGSSMQKTTAGMISSMLPLKVQVKMSLKGKNKVAIYGCPIFMVLTGVLRRKYGVSDHQAAREIGKYLNGAPQRLKNEEKRKAKAATTAKIGQLKSTQQKNNAQQDEVVRHDRS